MPGLETLGLRQMLCWQIHCSSPEQCLENWDFWNSIDPKFAINSCELSPSVAAAGLSAQRKVKPGVRSLNGGVLARSVCQRSRGALWTGDSASPKEGWDITSKQGLPFLSASSVLVYQSSQNQAQILCFLVKHACVSDLGRCVASEGVFRELGD